MRFKCIDLEYEFWEVIEQISSDAQEVSTSVNIIELLIHSKVFF